MSLSNKKPAYVDNVSYIQANISVGRYTWTNNEQCMLFREPGMPRVDFYPSTGKWVLVDTENKETMTGGAKEFVHWYFMQAKSAQQAPRSMTLSEYQEWTPKTAVYPLAILSLMEGELKPTFEVLKINYVTLGLVGEAGELANIIKKYTIRDIDTYDAVDRANMLSHVREELGGVLWYISELCNLFGFTIEQVLIENKNLLEHRLQAGTIQGHNREE